MAVDLRKLRAWWAKKQGLDGGFMNASPADVLQKTGWARSVGGVNPYVTIFARSGTSREKVDGALEKLEIHELPSARGCTYVLPASDFALGLSVGQGFGDEAAIRTAIKYLGVTEKEIERLCDRVLKALEKSAKDPRELKEDIGDAIRNLGEAGKKKGVTTTLPLALGRLQGQGRIRRIPTNGRLDQQRYAYALWSPSPLDKFKLTAEEAYAQLARKYFQWIGPATMAQFQFFAGLGAKATKAAVEEIGLEPLEKDSEHLILRDEMDSFQSFQTPKEPHYSLISSIDGLALLRRDLASLLEPSDQNRKMMGDKGMVFMKTSQDLQSHGIVDRGRVIGLWEFEPSSNRIVWNCFVKPDAKLKKSIDETEAFVRDQLGDARSFSLDSPESRIPRIEAIRS